MKVTRENEQLVFMIEKEQANQTIREFLQNYHLSRKKIHELYMDKKGKRLWKSEEQKKKILKK